ncbi:hypothetical protein ACH5RR_019087 [Cinchona calisaya]|uniref:VQ domain-containing protein n=1 Tax=Cinchona calisaya TaxID=153742 RepID=A0ABD2ZTI9_9GENT
MEIGNQMKKPSKEPLKVKYISSPVMVNAKSAAEFKAIVQELTGKDSSEDGHGQPINQGTSIHCGETNNYAKLGYREVERVQNDSSIVGNFGYEEDLFWKLSQSLSSCEFRYG